RASGALLSQYGAPPLVLGAVGLAGDRSRNAFLHFGWHSRRSFSGVAQKCDLATEPLASDAGDEVRLERPALQARELTILLVGQDVSGLVAREGEHLPHVHGSFFTPNQFSSRHFLKSIRAR